MKLSSLCRSLLCYNESKFLLAANSTNFQATRCGWSNISQRTYSDNSPQTLNVEEKKIVKISKAMKAYLKRSQEHESFLKDRIAEYEIGKRHLANMMGENAETFTQQDVDEAITYLLPSGLYDPATHPMVKHPSQIFPKRKSAEFDESGRPFHSLFYTGRPSYFSLLQEISIKAQNLDNLSDKIKDMKQIEKMNLDGSKWITKAKLENILMEHGGDKLFDHFIISMERLAAHPLGSREKEFILRFRKEIASEIKAEDIPKLMYTSEEIPYMTATGKRKTSTASVTVFGKGSGRITINGTDILYFDSLQDREQLMFPLQRTGLMTIVDVEAEVKGGGMSGRSGALRYAIALALRSFVDTREVEKMRISGLLTLDARKKERQKPGRRRARAKFTWKKR